ncbi:hypothetical protein VUR80DRAFT_6260 [Thermomyces stellatus]
MRTSQSGACGCQRETESDSISLKKVPGTESAGAGTEIRLRVRQDSAGYGQDPRKGQDVVKFKDNGQLHDPEQYRWPWKRSKRKGDGRL